MSTNSTKHVSNEHVNHIVTSILNKRQRKIVEQQQTFIQRDTDEHNKRNNYLLDRFTRKKRTIASKENVIKPIAMHSSPKKKTCLKILDDDDDDDFIAIKKRPKFIHQPRTHSFGKKNDPIKECLESILLQIENNDVICPICSQLLSNLSTIDERQQHVNQCLEQPPLRNIETKQQSTSLSDSKFSKNVRTALAPVPNLKCQICGMSFHTKHTYLAHLKRCSNQNSVQLKHIVSFASKTTNVTDEPKPVANESKQSTTAIKNRVIKMEVPRTEDDEQQQLAIALSNSMKTTVEPPNAFDVLRAASRKTKTIDLSTTPLWTVTVEDRLKLYSSRLSNICERLIMATPSTNSYKFPPSLLQLVSQQVFGQVDWWAITITDHHEIEIPMTQLTRILDDDDDDVEFT